MSQPKLHLSDSLSLPLDVVTQALGFLGRRGSGKTYGATKLAELLHEHGAQFVTIDPVGIWYGLRLSHDGKGKGLDVPIFGGLHGDIPIQAGAGAMLADVVVDRGLSAVLDVSQFEVDADKARFARDFAARFFYRKKASPSAVHVFVEECQEFIPQNPQKGEEQMLHAFQRMVRLGRNYGIGVSMISQRPQDVNKKALNQTECLFCFQLTGPQERKAVEGWVSEKGLQEDLGSVLPGLRVGNAHVWSPVWLDVNKEVRIAPKTTFPAGTTPKVGERPVTTKPLEPLELEQLHRDMASAVEQAKANDPKTLQAELARTKAELAKLKNAPAPAPVKAKEKRVEVPVLKDGQIDRLDNLVAKLAAQQDKAGALQAEIWKTADAIAVAVKLTRQPAGGAVPVAPAAPPRPAIPARPRAAEPAAVNVAVKDYTAREQLEKPMLRIIDAYAWWHSIGVANPSRENIAPIAGYSNIRSSGFRNPLYACQSAGLVADDALTERGRELAAWPEEVTSLEKYHAKLKAVLDGPAQKIFDALHEIGGATTREALAAAAEYTNVRSSGFRNPLYRLSSMGIVSLGKGDSVEPTELMYPESLAGEK